MKALIMLSSDPYKNEILPEKAWPRWVGQDGSPLTGEGYGYIFCPNLPEYALESATVRDFRIEFREVVKDGKTTIEKRAVYAPGERSSDSPVVPALDEE